MCVCVCVCVCVCLYFCIFSMEIFPNLQHTFSRNKIGFAVEDQMNWIRSLQKPANY